MDSVMDCDGCVMAETLAVKECEGCDGLFENYLEKVMGGTYRAYYGSTYFSSVTGVMDSVTDCDGCVMAEILAVKECEGCDGLFKT